MLPPVIYSRRQMERARAKKLEIRRDPGQRIRVKTVLRRGDPTRRLVETLGKNGGYVMSGAHQILDDIPPENTMAWIEAIR